MKKCTKEYCGKLYTRINKKEAKNRFNLGETIAVNPKGKLPGEYLGGGYWVDDYKVPLEFAGTVIDKQWLEIRPWLDFNGLIQEKFSRGIYASGVDFYKIDKA